MGVIANYDMDFDETEITFTKKLEKTLNSADINSVKINDMTSYQQGQYNMLNRIMVVVQQQLLKEITE